MRDERHTNGMSCLQQAIRGNAVVCFKRGMCSTAHDLLKVAPGSTSHYSPYLALMRFLRLWYTSQPMRMASENEEALQQMQTSTAHTSD